MVFKEIYTAIKTKLSTITAINNIEWYLDQDKKKGGIVQTPTVLIKFETSSTKQIAKKVQEVDVNFEIKIYTDYNKANHKLADDSIHFAIEDAIFAAMVGFEQIEIVPVQKDKALLFSSQTYKYKKTNNLPTPVPAQTIPASNITPVVDTTLA